MFLKLPSVNMQVIELWGEWNVSVLPSYSATEDKSRECPGYVLEPCVLYTSLFHSSNMSSPLKTFR